MGERAGNQSSRRAANAQNSSEEDEDEDEDEDFDDDRSNGSSMSRRQEEALFESAMTRIRQARAQGRVDVDLTRAELEAVNRMTERKRREAERRRREEQQQQRVSIPISHLDPSSFEDLLEDEPSSRQPSPPQIDDRQGYPPVGYFPAPKGRQRSSTTSSRATAARGRIPYDRDVSPDAYSATAARPMSRREDTSPFRYSYVSQNQPPAAIRHSSDPNRVRGSRVPSPRDPDEMLPLSNTSAPSLHAGSNVDPFQYMAPTSAGPRAPPSGAAAAARRRISVSNPTPAAAGGRSRGGSRRVSPDATEESSGDDTTSDDYSHGARVAPPTTRRAAREPPVIVEEIRTPTPEPPRRSSRSKASSKSPAKRKPAGSSSNTTSSSSRSKKKR
ncbi:hypothetical protein MCOR27_011595 [Pyricularia oryzae]|uniref:Uncharacterized protein n=5 Tax=Pyricularia TaxID=48558 RepID=A0ABQ8NJT4_PYRGI|nr:uncharacterized protein MGG_15245 [Pyricularia oryzae 70-15]KAH8848310.1 hypothetical protein MCOR01_001687 [Pyricularia oryzae]KAI6298172.1 hypothetical protein MCOR33_005631 [Pyricularia grisea]EHA53120.1 hypothetical protein MGG_15245 [Pyricularia oryzae 70-15]KAH9429745.1 hypothetical protein MCOR02_009482 [Pyricularia oryzae]KAI6263061.1 hypothetical protein MCOR19_000701 [Pyricularia oryzae]